MLPPLRLPSPSTHGILDIKHDSGKFMLSAELHQLVDMPWPHATELPCAKACIAVTLPGDPDRIASSYDCSVIKWFTHLSATL